MYEKTENNIPGGVIDPEDYLEKFGIPGLFPYQRTIINEICIACGSRISGAESDAPPRGLVLLPTGAGKSICYMLPAFIIPGYSLIVYPLNALINDQQKRFLDAGICCRSMIGGMSKGDKISLISDAVSGRVRVLLANPESLLDPEIQEALKKSPPLHVVFDEAHTSAEWGLTFRPAYLKVCSFIRNLAPARVSAFTATASPELLPQMAKIIFGNRDYSLYSMSPSKENISFSAVPAICREAEILHLAGSRLETPMIIFCRRRKDAENSARLLAERLNTGSGDRVRFYHAGLTRKEKQQVENWFMKGGDLILCATCAFGLGVDCPGVRSVLHLAPPSSVEAYVQESGRAGRDGKPCRAVMLFGPEDLSEETLAFQGKRYSDLVSAFLSNRRCRRVSLMKLFNPGETHSPCGICDVCTGSVQFMPRGFREILGLLRKFSGLLSPGEASEILKGYGPGRSGGRHRMRHFFGLLGDWDYNWCQEAIGLLEFCGAVRRKRFSGRLSAVSLRKQYADKSHS